MSMKKIICAALCAASLSACATLPSLSQHHNGCMDSAPTFKGQVDCVAYMVAADPYMRDDTLVREYIQTGEILAAEVARGQMFEAEARLRFVEKLNDVKERQLRRDATETRMMRDMQSSFPRQTTCVPVGNTTQCTTY
jgi:uncharacterized lipoprotein